MKIYFKDEDDLSKLFCELMSCEGEQPTESDPTGCTGCDASEEWLDKNYSEFVLDEQKYKEYISKVELFERIDSELKYEKTQKTEKNNGYFSALRKLKSKVEYPNTQNPEKVQEVDKK